MGMNKGPQIPSPGAPKQNQEQQSKRSFVTTEGFPISIIEQKDIEGIKVGDKLTLKEGAYRPTFREDTKAEVVGFTSDDKVAIQLDGDKVALETIVDFQNYYENWGPNGLDFEKKAA